MSSARSVLLELLRSSRARKHNAGYVWRLDGQDRETLSLRRSLLSTAILTQRVFVHYDGDSPDGLTLAGTKEVEPQVWELAPQASADDLSRWLYMGNWQLYSKDEPLQVIPDLCRASDLRVAGFVDRAGIDFIIDSFHDDDHWTIGVRQDRDDA
jgi:hypothetical protein